MAIFSAQDRLFMEIALTEAAKAAVMDEVPVGAVVVFREQIIGRGYNMKENGRDATLHSEMIALRQACAAMGGWRLPGAVMYVTLEPCPMCAGALVQARLEKLIYAAADPKSGACGSVLDICRNPALNHQVQVAGGLLAEESALLLKQFFAKKRQKIDRENGKRYNKTIK